MAVTLRPASPADLPRLNTVVEAAVMTWNLPERVKRLALPTYRYSLHDLEHLEIMVAEGEDGILSGVAAWEAADPRDLPPGHTGLLLHGLYVEPNRQGKGIGTQLLQRALAAASDRGLDGLLVKAQADAEAFFLARGLQRLPVQDPARHYAYRLWRGTGRGR